MTSSYFDPPVPGITTEFGHQISHPNSQRIELLFNENAIILASAVLSQYTRVTNDPR